MKIIVISVFIVSGIILGAFLAFLIMGRHSQRGNWTKFSMTLLSSGVLTFILSQFDSITKRLNLENQNTTIGLLVFLLGILISFYLLSNTFIKSFKNLKLGFSSFFFGYFDIVYEELRLRVEKLEEFKDYKKCKRIKDDVTKQRQLLSNQIKLNKGLLKRIDEMSDEKVTLELPIEHPWIWTSEIAKVFPSLIDEYKEFCQSINYYSEQYIFDMLNENELIDDSGNIYESEIDKKISAKSKEFWFRGYLFMLCNTFFEEFSAIRGIRIIARRLNKDKDCYESILISYPTEENETKATVTPIPASDEGLIHFAGKYKRSLVASANSKNTFHTKNYPSRWTDFITIPFPEFFNEDEQPIFTLTISVKNEIEYRNLLYFLSYIKIEESIEKVLLNFDKYCKFSTLLEESELTS